MPRLRANNYDAKKALILDAAANLFANQGYSGCKMQDIAVSCKVSKSMLYHYFPKKEDVLFEILKQHLDRLLLALNEHSRVGDARDIDAFFYEFIEVYLEKSQLSRARHVVALHDRRYLTKEQLDIIIRTERAVIAAVEDTLSKIDPHRDKLEYRPYALLLIGMMNWIELWYRRSGRVSPPSFYKMIGSLYLHGFAPSGADVTLQHLARQSAPGGAQPVSLDKIER